MTDDTIRHIATVFPIDPEAVKLRRSGSIIKEFSLNTSTHGIPGIARSHTIHNRIFWSASLLIFAGAMFYFVIESIITYFQYPTQTNVAFIVEWPQVFPAVTICNYSPLRYDRFIGPFINYTNTFNLTNITDPSTFNFLANATDSSNFTYQQSLYVRDFMVYKLNQGESLNDMFYSLESMMMGCNFNGIPCSVENFTWFTTPSFGLCYTFNAKLKNNIDNSLRYTSDNGGIGLFQSSFYAHQHQYVPYLSSAIGMVVLVHDNEELPFIELSAMQLAAGRHHKLGYTIRESVFLPAPYTTCNDKLNLGMEAMYNHYEGTDYGYSQFQCYMTCIQAYTYQKCGCGNPLRWGISSVVLPGSDKAINVTFCDTKNTCYGGAANELMNTKSLWTIYCPDCTPECSTTEYIVKLSSLLAPPKVLMNDIKQFVESSTVLLPVNWSTTWVSEIQSSYVSLEVAYETIRTELYTQQATLGAVDVVSNVGGQTGLWIGISFLSLMEMAEMAYRLIRYQCHRVRKGIRKKIRKR